MSAPAPAYCRAELPVLIEVANVDAGKIIITFPVVRIITCSFLDACRVIVAHEQRHILQARRVAQLPQFPK